MKIEWLQCQFSHALRLSIWLISYNKMRGGKLVVIFLLLGLALGQWITEQPKNQVISPIPEPIIGQSAISQPPPPVPLEIVEVHPQMTQQEVPQQAITSTVQKQASQEPSGYNDSLDMFDHHNRIPDSEIEKYHRRSQGSHKEKRHHSKERRQYKSEQTGLAEEEQKEGCLQMIMDNGIFLLAALGILGLIVTKICIRKNKCGMTKARKENCVNQHAIHMEVPNVPCNENQAIGEAIRYHQTQILMLRNAAAHPPAYIPYQ